jgi:hypothetical protein
VMPEPIATGAPPLAVPPVPGLWSRGITSTSETEYPTFL